MKIKVVTDGSCDLPQELVKNYHIEIVPLHTILNDKDAYLTPDEIIEKMNAGNTVKTSQVTPTEFEETYSQILQEYDGILSVHLSQKLSGTYASAVTSAKKFNGKIEVIDSMSTSAALGAMVLKAVEFAKTGKLKESAEKLREFSKKVETIFGIKVIDNLVKGGRVGPLVGRLTKMFNAKPVLRGIDGEIKLYKVTLGFKRVLREIVNFINNHKILDNKIVIAHIHAESDVEYIRAHTDVEIISCRAGPTITVHGGYGFILVGFISE